MKPWLGRQKFWYRQRFAEEDSGVSLIEVIVTLGLTSSVIAMATSGLVISQRSLGANASRLDGISQNKVAIEAMGKTIRTAVEPRLLGSPCDTCAAFIQGDNKKVKFFAALSSMIEPVGTAQTSYGPVKVSYTFGAGKLTETEQLPDLHAPSDHNYTYCTPGATGCVVRSRVLAHNIVDAPVFTYYDQSGNVLALPLETSSDRLLAVDSIDVVVASRPSTAAETSTVVTRISLVNSGAEPTSSPTATP
jgi:hypothetical protein